MPNESSSPSSSFDNLRKSLRQSLTSPPISSYENHSQPNSPVTKKESSSPPSTKKKINHNHNSQNHYFQSLEASSLSPSDYANLSPSERQELKQRLLNFTRISSTVASSPKRQTSNWHGTYLEPLCDHNNTALHPSPGPGAYYVDGFFKKDDLERRNQSHVLTNHSHSSNHNDLNFLKSQSASRFADDVAVRHLSPASTKYQKLEDISTIEVNVNGLKKKIVAKDATNNNTYNNSGEINNSISRSHESNLQSSPWKQEQERKHREQLTTLASSSSPRQKSEMKTNDEKRPKKEATFSQKIKEEERKRKEDQKYTSSSSSSPKNRYNNNNNKDKTSIPSAPLSETTNFTGAGYYYNSCVDPRTIQGRCVNSSKKKLGGTINVPLCVTKDRVGGGVAHSTLIRR